MLFNPGLLPSGHLLRYPAEVAPRRTIQCTPASHFVGKALNLTIWHQPLVILVGFVSQFKYRIIQKYTIK